MLISRRTLDNEFHHFTFGNHQWKLKNGILVVARGQKWGTLNRVEVSDVEAHTVEEAGASSLWHNRLGNMNKKGIKLLVRSKFII